MKISTSAHRKMAKGSVFTPLFHSFEDFLCTASTALQAYTVRAYLDPLPTAAEVAVAVVPHGLAGERVRAPSVVERTPSIFDKRRTTQSLSQSRRAHSP
jgi:hypothetical protein